MKLCVTSVNKSYINIELPDCLQISAILKNIFDIKQLTIVARTLLRNAGKSYAESPDRVGVTGLRPSPLPHHRTCGFPHTAVESNNLCCRKF